MSPQERARLARTLAGLDDASGASATRGIWQRRLVIAAAAACAVGLVAWIGVLAITLPVRYRAGGWSAAWIGFDAALAVVFGATAWAAWRRRQVLIGCLVVLAVLLCCDAWFDTMLDLGTPDFMASLLLAVCAELPLALVALIAARRLLRLTMARIDTLEGAEGPVPPLWQIPLFGQYSSASGYRHVVGERYRTLSHTGDTGQDAG